MSLPSVDVVRCPQLDYEVGTYAHRFRKFEQCLKCPFFRDSYLTKKRGLLRIRCTYRYRASRFKSWDVLEITQKFQCPICHQMVLTLKHIEECRRDFERQKQIQKNLEIISATNVSRLRRDLAIYRLYRYCDYSPELIVYSLGITIGRKRYHTKLQEIRAVIGSVFGMLCLSSKSCVFKKQFEQMVESTENEPA